MWLGRRGRGRVSWVDSPAQCAEAFAALPWPEVSRATAVGIDCTPVITGLTYEQARNRVYQALHNLRRKGWVVKDGRVWSAS